MIYEEISFDYFEITRENVRMKKKRNEEDEYLIHNDL